MKENNAAAAGAICDNAQAKAEEVERRCKGNIVNDSVVTANEIGGWHRGRAILSTASEDEDHVAFNNDRVKHDMNDDPNENEKTAEVTGEEHFDRDTVNDDADNVETAKEFGGRRRGRPVLRTVNEEDDFTEFHHDLVEHNTDDGMEEKQKNQAQSRRCESSSTETTSTVAVAIVRMSGDEHSDRNTTKVETDLIQGDGHHALFPHLVAEAGSIVLHVSNNMNEVKKGDEDSEDGEEEGGSAAAKESEEISRKDAENRRLIELRRSTPKEEKRRLKEVSKSIKKCIRDKKRVKSEMKKVLITKIQNERGEIITSRKGIANVFGEFCKKLYDDNEQDEYENESNTDVHISDTEEMTRIPEITSEELQDAIRKLKKR